jgi:dipeptidyl aminopeptidase/acylaminoacyl peptidase
MGLLSFQRHADESFGGGHALLTQFCASRGFAMLDFNYGGSTGFGRAYRELLSGQWDVVDVEDCIAGASCLVAEVLADADRLAIRGGSAGGYTPVAALALRCSGRWRSSCRSTAQVFGFEPVDEIGRVALS